MKAMIVEVGGKTLEEFLETSQVALLTARNIAAKVAAQT